MGPFEGTHSENELLRFSAPRLVAQEKSELSVIDTLKEHSHGPNAPADMR